MASNILNGHETVTVNGSTSIQGLTFNASSKFDFWFKITNFVAPTDSTLPEIEFAFDAEEGSTWYQTCRINVLVIGDSEYGHIEFSTSIKAVSLDIIFIGNYTISNMQLYSEEVSIEVATTEKTGIVRTPSTSAISVAIADSEDGTTKAGDIDIKLGDGITKNADNQLCTTSDLSGSNLESIKFHTATGAQGLEVNGKYFFQKVDGGMQYLNAGRKIPVTKSTTSVVDAYNAYIASIGGGTSGN